MGFRFTAERFYQVGFLNRLVAAGGADPGRDGDGRASALAAAGLARQYGPHDAPDAPRALARRSKALAAKLHDHGDKSDLMESRAAFAEKRKPNFKGWLDPQDRYRMPKLEESK